MSRLDQSGQVETTRRGLARNEALLAAARARLPAATTPEQRATAEAAVQEATQLVQASHDNLRIQYRMFELEPHHQTLVKFIQNGVRGLAGLSLALVTGVIAWAGVGTVPEDATDTFRTAIRFGLWGLGLAFAYFVPLLAAQAIDLRFLLRPDQYQGKHLVGQAESAWAVILGLLVVAAQFLAWAAGVLKLGHLAEQIQFGPPN